MALLIFDLDGTLIDSSLDLALAVNAMLEQMQHPLLPHERIYSYVGNGSPALVRRALGGEPSEAVAARGLEFFLAYYREHMLDNTRLYAGVRQALDRLQASGCPMAVLTNKPVRFSQAIIDGLGLTAHFFRIYGGNSFEQKKPHPVGVERLLEESGESKESAWMVGDSAVDVRTARGAGIRAAGVSYGFQPETFRDDPPDLMIDDLGELADHLLLTV